MSRIPAPLIDADDERTPVTVYISPSHATRLELLLSRRQEISPAADENAFVDAMFAIGLLEAERIDLPRALLADVKPGVTVTTPAVGDAASDGSTQAPARPENAPSAAPASLQGATDGGDGQVRSLAEQLEITNDLVAAQAAFIQELTARISEAAAPSPISATVAIAHLQELMTGTAATLHIQDNPLHESGCGDGMVSVVFGADKEAIRVYPADVVELVDALTTIENFRMEIPF